MSIRESPSIFRTLDLRRMSPELRRALLIAAGLALIWWLAAMLVRGANLIPVWYDQSITFTRVTNLADPYRVPTFLYPPWTALLLFPNSLLSLPAATLLQTLAYFMLLTAVVVRYGGGTWAVLIALTSFIAFDAVLELNIEWIVMIGLLLPPAASGPFLLVKPQIALGVWFSVSWRDLLKALGVLAVAGAVSLLLWGWWPPLMLHAIQTYTIHSGAISGFNIAPMTWLTLPLSLAIGTVAAVVARRRKDPALAILAWLFFVPYLTAYSALPALAMAAARWPRFTLLLSILIWLIYGGALLLALLAR